MQPKIKAKLLQLSSNQMSPPRPAALGRLAMSDPSGTASATDEVVW